MKLHKITKFLLLIVICNSFSTAEVEFTLKKTKNKSFIFLVPDDWEMYEDMNIVRTLYSVGVKGTFSQPDNYAGMSVVEIVNHPDFTHLSQESKKFQIGKQNRDIKASMDTAYISEIEPIKTFDNEAYKLHIIFKERTGKRLKKREVIYIYTKVSLVYFIYEAPLDEWDKYQEIFDKNYEFINRVKIDGRYGL